MPPTDLPNVKTSVWVCGNGHAFVAADPTCCPYMPHGAPCRGALSRTNKSTADLKGGY